MNRMTWWVMVVLCVTAKGALPQGLWEADAWELEGYNWHWVLRLGEDGQFVRTQLSDDPVQPFIVERGTFVSEGRTIQLDVPVGSPIGPGRYALATDASTLTWQRGIAIEMVPGREVNPLDLVGLWWLWWQGTPTGSWIRFDADGTFDADLGSLTEHGPYHIAGSAMVHWPTEASDPNYLGVPGVWTAISVEGDQLSYTIAPGAVQGKRERATNVALLGWGALKTRQNTK